MIMTTITTTLVPLLVGVLVGLVVALLHHRASWRASRDLARSGRVSAVLWGLPLRVGLPATTFLLLARWTPVAMIAGLVAFGATAWLAARRRLEREAA